ncbi:hypothetical protein TTHERM_01645010 (macronuclear) [Tetrahymena thermophila SB210]|uniref:Transmembrane protein n=1 Tax=Tetrahymena thermophila (strain SB210) TaxID=312017 RepID=Q227Y1_TETTS|nr:hypothetical protein TTHERM_01645010 [Tetrahymena thermophila SB210]EAR81598.2 hypothetical protein TTHERM_01645010 [Tetrahymena thermophila SB210]|eukprot:XP_001029261.2 hypothetical protein TTHERM_01645010 [Tetrahymena thermophila SB210]
MNKIGVQIYLLVQLLFMCLACPSGCNSCYLDLKGVERCQECQTGFSYFEQTNICVQEKCEVNQSSFEANKTMACMSVCPQSFVLDSTSNKCISANSCSTQYLQLSSISNGQKIIDASFDQDGYIQVIYSYFVNKINAYDGSFIRQYSFNLSLMLIKCINQQIYLVTNENKVYFWDQINQKNVICSVIQQGTVNALSDVLLVSNNQSRSFITSFQQQQNKVFFTEINAANNNQSQLEINFLKILMVMDQRNQMSIINNNFQIILQNVQQYGILVDVKMYEPDIFFTLFYSSQSNLAYPCQFGYLEITQNGVIQRPITYTIVSIKLSIVRKITDDNNQEIYLFNGILAFSYTLVGQIKWYKQSGIQLRGNQNYIIGETITQEITNIQNTISYVGAASGYLGVSPLNQDYPIQKVYSIQKMYSQDTIQFIKRSFKLGSYYVIKISSIQIFNLFSNELIEQINFDLKISTNPDSFENIVDLYISDNLGIFLSFNRQQIIVKDQINNLNYTIKQSQISNSLNQIQGCWIDETYSKILAYGKILVEFNLDLSNMNNLSPAGHFNYEICFFMVQFVVCKINTNSISIYDKLQQYKVQANILIQTLTLKNFNLQIDQKLQYIFAYQNQIEIYNFQGSYLSSINGSSQPIFQFDICSSYLLAYTPSAAMIISRQTLQIVKNIIPSIGQLRKGFYFPQINLIAYQTNEITTGQIKFFSLNTLQPQGSITQPFKPNGVGNSLDAKYDQESNVIFYVDTYGNSQIATLGSTVSNQNIIGISELQLQQTAPPVDYFLDFDMNEIFIHNGQYIWRQSYNIQTKVYQRVYHTEKQFYILIQSQANSLLNSILVCDNSYNLFLYDQQKMVFIQRFQDQVTDMKQFVQFNQVINIVAFSSQFFTYQFNQNYLIVTTFNFTNLDNQNQKQNILLVSLSSGELASSNNVTRKYHTSRHKQHESNKFINIQPESSKHKLELELEQRLQLNIV